MKIGTGGFSVVADNEYKLFRIVVAEGEQVQFETAGFAGATLGIDRKLIHSVEPIKWTYKKANKWTELPLYLDKDGEQVSLHNEYGDLTLPSDYGIWDTETQVRAELLDVDGNLYFDEITLYRLSPKSGFRVVLNNTVAQLQKNKLGNFNLEDLKFSYKVYDNETLLSEGAADGQYEVKPSFDYGTVEIGGGRGGVVNLTSTLENEMEVRLGFSINKVGSETNTRKTAYFKVINHSLGHSWHVSSSSMLLEYDESGAKPVSIKVGLLDGTKYASRELYEVTYVNGDNIQGSLTEEADHYTYTLTEMNQDESQVTFYIKTINNDVAQKTVSLKRRAQSVPVLNFGFEPAPVTFTYRTNKSVVEDYVDVSTILEYGRKSLFDPEQAYLLEACDVNLFVPEIYLNDIEIVQVDNNRLHQIKTSPTFSVSSDSVEIPVTLEGTVKIVGYPETTVKSTGRIQFLPSPVISDGLISDVDVLYGLSDSTIDPPTEWQTEAPQWVEGMFMWTKTVKYFGDGNFTETDPTCISGSSGQNGVGIDYIKEWYYWGSSATSVPSDAIWEEEPGPWRPTEYLWTKSEIRYTDGSFTETAQICTTGAPGSDGANAQMIVVSGEQVFKYTNNYGSLTGPSSITITTSVQGVSSPNYTWKVKPVGGSWTTLDDKTASLTVSPTGSYWGAHKQLTFRCELSVSVYDEISIVKVTDGANGSQGLQGPPGTNGQSQYFHVRYSVNADGSNMDTSPTGAIYMGTAITQTSAAPTSHTAYTWSKILGDQGPQGNQGTPGQAGSDGKTPYLHIKYSDNGTSFTANNGETPGSWLGQYVDFIATDSTVFGDYTWSKIQGLQGNQGIQGPPGPDGQSLYTWVRYADDANGGGLHDSPEGKAYIGLAYNKTVREESSNPLDYTWALIEGPQGVQGPDGKTKYTWLKYADTPTSGIHDNPAGKKYMGVAYNKDTPDETNNYADYQWSLIQGAAGSDAYTVILSNENHTFAADSSGSIPKQITITTEVIAMKGTALATPVIGTPTPSVSGLVVDVSSNPISITASMGSSLPDSGSINIPITVDGHAFVKVFSWTKTKQGANGQNGSDAQYVRLSGNQIFKFAAGAAKPVPEDIVLSASLVGLSGNGQWSYRKPGETTQTGLGVLQAGNYTVNYNAAEWSGTNSVTYRFTVGGKYDEITLAKIYDGAEGEDSYTVILTNESHSIACNELGAPISGELGQSGKAVSTIEVYKGSQKLVGGGTSPLAGQFHYTIGSSVDGVAAKMPNSNDTFYIDSVTGDSGTIPVTINIEGVQTVKKVMSFSKAKKGTTGANGNDGITMMLTNDSHTIPTDSGGNNGVYTGAKTKVVIYSSVSDVTDQWSVVPTVPNTIHGSWNNTSKEYTVTNMTADSAEITFTASRAGFTSLTRTFSLSKNKQGVAGSDGADGSNGVDAVVYEMNLTSLAINKKVDNTLSPSTITVSSTKIVGNATPVAYAGRFRVSESLDGSNFTDKYTSAVNEASKVYTPSSANVKAIKFEHFLAGGTTTKLDEQTIPVLSDGVNGTGVEYVDVEYGVSTDPKMEPAAGSWSTNSPTWTSGTYIWTRTKTKFTGIADPVYSKPACITGNSGVGVSNIIEQYAISSSNQTAPAENSADWKDTPPGWETGKYIWTRSKITYSNGSTGYTTPYCDKSWEAIDGIVVGGTNLLKKSKPNITSVNYNIANLYFDNGSPAYRAPVHGNIVTISVKAALAAGKTGIGIYNSGGSVHVTTLTSADLKADGVYRKTVPWVANSAANTHASIYMMPSSVSGSSSTLEWVKLERGNKATDWSAHPLDEIEGSQLPPNIITADKILAGSIETKHISADGISANTITTGTLDASKITVDKLSASVIQTGTLDASKVNVDKLSASVITTGTLDASKVNVSNLNADNITSGQVSADRVEIGNVYNIIKNQPETEKDTTARPVISHSDGYKYYDLTTSGATASRIELWSSSVYEFLVNEEYVFDSYGFKAGSTTGSIRFTVLYTDNSEANVAGPINLSLGTTAASVSQTILKISSEPDKTKTIKKVSLYLDKNNVAGSVRLRNLRAVKKTSGALIQDGTIQGSKLIVDQGFFDTLNTNSLFATNVQATNLTASQITTEFLDAVKIKADNITAGKLDATNIEVTNLKADSIKGGTLDMQGVTVKDLKADQISGGTLNTKNVTIKGTSEENVKDVIMMEGSRLTFLDGTLSSDGAEEIPRIQIGRFAKGSTDKPDAVPGYGIIITNKEGKPVFDSDYGGLLPEGLIDSSVSSDKLVGVSKDKLPADILYEDELAAKKITGSQLVIKDGGLTVSEGSLEDELVGIRGKTTFSVDVEGNVFMDGTLNNADFVAGKQGYRISPDGNTEFNNTVVRGTVELPNAGITEKGFSVIEQKTFSVGGNISAWARDVGYIVQQIIALNLNSVTIPVRFQIPSATSSEVVVDSSDTLLASQIYDSLRSQGYADLVKIIFEPYPYIAGGAVPETDFNPTDKAAFFANWAIQMKNAISQLSFVPDEYYVSSNMIHLENEYDSWVALREELRAVLPNSKSIYRTNWWTTATWSQSHIDAYNAKLANPVFGLFDVIAIAAYFELNESASPSVATLKADLLSSSLYGRGQNIYQEIKNFYTEWGKPIYFGELGCAHYDFAAREPWNTDPSAVYNETVQKNLFQAYVETFGDESWFKGFSVFAIGDDTSKFNIFGKQAGTYIASLNTSVDNKFSPVRIWAGSSFKNRYSAPFRVLQDGTVFALNGYYSGVLNGELKTDYVHIHDDAIELNRTASTFDNNSNGVLRFAKEASYINSDSISMLNGSLTLNPNTSYNEANFVQTNVGMTTSTGLTNVLYETSSGPLSGFNLIATEGGGRHVFRHSTAADKKEGTLVLDSEGGQGAKGDFSFTRKNYVEDVVVDVSGSLNVRKSITSNTNKVEMRATSDGWGFYIV